MVVAGLAAILALIVGAAVGRSIIPSPDEPERPDPVRFVDSEAGISLSYPGDWRRLTSTDTQVRLLAADGPARSLLLRVTGSEIEKVSEQTLPIAREFTDSLLSADQRARMLEAPEAITLGGMLGYRYRYTYSASDGSAGAHVHYFLFRPEQLVQLVFQAIPASGLAAAEPTFESIAATVRNTKQG